MIFRRVILGDISVHPLCSIAGVSSGKASGHRRAAVRSMGLQGSRFKEADGQRGDESKEPANNVRSASALTAKPVRVASLNGVYHVDEHPPDCATMPQMEMQRRVSDHLRIVWVYNWTWRCSGK